MSNTVKDNTTFNYINVTPDSETSVRVSQPVTSIINVLTPGPQGPVGPQGPAGPSGSAAGNFLGTGSLSASLFLGSTLFLINSGSSNFFTISNQGSTTVSSSASDIFLIKGSNNVTLFSVSQSGVITLATQSAQLTGNAPNGGIYFTSSSFYVGLE